MLLLLVLEAMEEDARTFMERLYHENGKRMMAVALKRLKEKELAKDAVQTALLRLCACAKQLMQMKVKSMRVYIFRVIVTSCIDCEEEEARQRGIEQHVEDLGEIPSEEPTVLEELVDEATKEELRQCMEQLTQREVEVLMQRIVQEDTQKRVAERYGVSEQTIRAWERKALERLRALWNAMQNEEEGGIDEMNWAGGCAEAGGGAMWSSGTDGTGAGEKGAGRAAGAAEGEAE